jgi:hypothetical protein
MPARKIPARPRRRGTDVAAALGVLVAVSAWLNFSHDRITDPDSFYHYRHAWVYATQGPFTADFPWPQFSVIRTLAADLWYGLHVLMIPLTWMADPVAALKIGSFVSTTTAAALVYLALRRMGAAWPLGGTCVFLFATADLLYRVTMLRPHPISLGLTLLLFADLIVDTPDRDRRRLVRLGVLAALVAWLHLAVAWLPLLVAAAAAAVRWSRRGPADVAGVGAVLVGVLVGTVLRPHAWAALKLAWIQVAYLSQQHQGQVPLRFGRELTPLHWRELYKQLGGLCLLLLAALATLIGLRRRRVDLRVGVWTSLAVWPIFFMLAFTVFRRANEVMVAFAVAFVGLLAARLREAVARGPARGLFTSTPGLLAALVAFVGLLWMPFSTWERYRLFMPNAFDPERFHAVGAWLEENSAPGEIVFNADWDRFGYLVFWGPRNRYIHGMDPIFMYAYDPALYWKSHYLSMDAVTSFTCGQMKCSAALGEDTHTVLRRDFRASFILVERNRNPSLLAYLESAPGFQKAFETPYEVLFRIT